MIQLRAGSILTYRRYKILQFLIFSVKYDNICKEIEQNLNFFEKTYKKIKVLKVSWWEFISFFEVPRTVSMYTVFCLYDGITVGSVIRPNLLQLVNLLNECKKLVEASDWSKNRLNIFTKYRKYNKPFCMDESSFGSRSNSETTLNDNFKILSLECPIYQFKRKRKTYNSNVEGNFIYNRIYTKY